MKLEQLQAGDVISYFGFIKSNIVNYTPLRVTSISLEKHVSGSRKEKSH